MVIADTGFWLALANRRDGDHAAAVQALARLNEPLICTWPVMTEACHLLLNRLGRLAQERFLDNYRDGGFRVFDLQHAHAPRILELMQRYRDLPMDLADASLVVLAEDLGDGRILSTDRRDFSADRWKNRQPFQNLLDI